MLTSSPAGLLVHIYHYCCHDHYYYYDYYCDLYCYCYHCNRCFHIFWGGDAPWKRRGLRGSYGGAFSVLSFYVMFVISVRFCLTNVHVHNFTMVYYILLYFTFYYIV